MRGVRAICATLFLWFASGTAAQAQQGPAHPAQDPSLDPCSLLSAREIQEVQGTAVREVKRSRTPGGSLLTVQCFFQGDDLPNSVSLVVIVPNEKMHTAARQFWMERFHPKAGGAGTAAKQETPGAETPQKKRPPRAIPELGEEAYWVGDNWAGSLYVLQDEVFLRISAGGSGNESAKIDRSIALARHALKRLPGEANPAPAAHR